MGALMVYLILAFGSRGSLWSDVEQAKTVGNIVEIIGRFFVGLPLSIIDLIPIIFAFVMIVAVIFDRPIKALWGVFLLPLIFSHGLYFFLKIIGFVVSWQLIAATILLSALTIYVLFVFDRCKKIEKHKLILNFNVEITKYNLLVTAILCLVIVSSFLPTIGAADKVELVLDIANSSQNSNGFLSGLGRLANGGLSITLKIFNGIIYFIKIPILVAAFVELFDLKKKKDLMPVINKFLLVYTMIVLGGLDFMIKRMGLEGLFEVSIFANLVVFLLIAWLIVEIILVRELGQLAKNASKKMIEKYNLYFNITSESKFSIDNIKASMYKIPILGKQIAKYFDNTDNEGMEDEFIQSEIIDDDYNATRKTEVTPKSESDRYDLQAQVENIQTIKEDRLLKLKEKFKSSILFGWEFVKKYKYITSITALVVIALFAFTVNYTAMSQYKKDYINTMEPGFTLNEIDIQEVERSGGNKFVSVLAKEVKGNIQIEKETEIKYYKNKLSWKYDCVNTFKILDEQVINEINQKDIVRIILEHCVPEDIMIDEEMIIKQMNNNKSSRKIVKTTLKNDIKEKNFLFSIGDLIELKISPLIYNETDDYSSANIMVSLSVIGDEFSGTINNEIVYNHDEEEWRCNTDELSRELHIVPNDPIDNQLALDYLKNHESITHQKAELFVVDNILEVDNNNICRSLLEFEVKSMENPFYNTETIYKGVFVFTEDQWILDDVSAISSQVTKNQSIFKTYRGKYYKERPDIDGEVFISDLPINLVIDKVDENGNILGSIELDVYQEVDYIQTKKLSLIIDPSDLSNSSITNPDFEIKKEVFSLFVSVVQVLDVSVQLESLQYDEVNKKFTGELKVSGNVTREKDFRSDTLKFEVK
jgi:hypothetical protein